MNVSICASVTYYFETDVPNETINLDKICENADPVFSDLCKTLTKHHLNFTGQIHSIVNNNTNEVLYVGD